jgi:hypothetical protein
VFSCSFGCRVEKTEKHTAESGFGAKLSDDETQLSKHFEPLECLLFFGKAKMQRTQAHQTRLTPMPLRSCSRREARQREAKKTLVELNEPREVQARKAKNVNESSCLPVQR